MSKTRRTPGVKLEKCPYPRIHSSRGIRAVVHWRCVWINGEPIQYLSGLSFKRFVKILLDAGVTVRGYWRDVNYKSIDPRISSRGGRV